MSKLEFCLINLEGFSRSYHMSRLLRDIYPKLDRYTLNYATFQHLHNTLLCDSVVSWCRIFGSDREELHWKKVVPDTNNFKDRLADWSGFSSEDFREYQKSLVIFRNKVAAHLDPDHFSNGSTPHLDIANTIANKAYSYFCALEDHKIDKLCHCDSLENYGAKAARHLTLRLEI